MASVLGSRQIFRGVVLPAILAVGCVALLVGAVLLYATQRSDTLAQRRQEQQLALAIDQSVREIQNEQEASTLWDDAVLRLRERPLDMVWLDNNLGEWFHDYYQHDEVYLVAPDGTPLYAMREGERVAPDHYASLARTIGPMATQLRSALVSGAAEVEPGSGQTPGLWTRVMVNGHPAIVSVKPVLPEAEEIVQSPQQAVMHASVRYLDGTWVQRIGQDLDMQGLRFTETLPGESAADEVAMPLTDSAGETIGYLAWTPFRPGLEVRHTLLPVMLGALLLVALLLVVLLLRNRRARIELEASREEARHQAFHDPLTGLPNRALFDDRLRHALLRRGQGRVALILLDLDRFKNVNDTHGHQAGDALIREFGQRLENLLRAGDSVARLGGDEFALMIEDTTEARVTSLCERMLDAVRAPFSVVGNEAYVGISAGIAMSSDEVGEASELTRRADIALYRAKGEGRGTFRFFASDMDESVKQRGTIEVQLRQALAAAVPGAQGEPAPQGHGLHLLFQPQVSGASGAIVGLEALVRWQDPVLGLVPTEDFIPVAEETGLIVQLGDWVLEQAARVAAQWPHLFMAVNLSPVQFRDPRIAEHIAGIVSRAGANPARIQLEVTERLLLDDSDLLRDTLDTLRDHGFRVVLDDFGTGYSSLSYLQKFQVDKIKIDQSFVRDIGQAEDASSIVLAILALAAALRLGVTAEGVETEAQRRFLAAAGCGEMQGYLFSRPVSVAGLADLLAPADRRTGTAA